MRLKILFGLKEKVLPLDYRPVFLSFIKHSLLELYPDLYNELYGENKNTVKPFTFSIGLKNPVFNSDLIRLGGDTIGMTFSTYDYPMYIRFYNAFLKQKNKHYSLPFQNNMVLQSIKNIDARNIKKSEVVIKFESPLIVRLHNKKANTDYYYDYSHDSFENTLLDITKEQARELGFVNVSFDNFSLKPIIPGRTVVTLFGNKVNTSLGVYKLTCNNQLLNYLYNSGIGSRRSQGFGMFEIIS